MLYEHRFALLIKIKSRIRQFFGSHRCYDFLYEMKHIDVLENNKSLSTSSEFGVLLGIFKKRGNSQISEFCRSEKRGLVPFEVFVR